MLCDAVAYRWKTIARSEWEATFVFVNGHGTWKLVVEFGDDYANGYGHNTADSRKCRGERT